ncbi:MAG: hypothetical protein WBA93_15985 [Microcoleaceae cyanobacterium]
MPIQTDKNINYGGNLVVSQKYRPLENIHYVQDDRDYYSALLTNRWNLLNAANILPQPLALVTPNWKTIIAAEARKSPPLVVISSNRSNWIKQGIDAADNQLATKGTQNFANASDLSALSAQAGQLSSPPIYCPTRIGPAPPNRNVYIVVHMYEYEKYKKTLAGTGITVVGWLFKPPDRTTMKDLTGFGASRFAAIEFCKHLRTQATLAGRAAPWNYAWLFDDNVVALTNFPGYAAVEAVIGSNVCAGFHGGTKAESFEANKTWAIQERAKNRGGQAAALPSSMPPGIVQQAALWNIDYLTKNNLNFSPVYISSGEDISFVNYFNTKQIPYFYYKGIGVRKEITSYDNDESAQNVNQARQEYTAWFSDAEKATPAGAVPLPPPVEVTPIKQEDGGVQTLADFIVNHVLPNSQMNSQDNNDKVKYQAKCQGVEQITSGAIWGKTTSGAIYGYVNQDALDNTFKINGMAAQIVKQVDQP